MLFFSTLVTSHASAASNVMTLSGTIHDPSNAPIESSSVTFVFAVLPPSGNCILYRESTVLNMSGSKGRFEHQLGSILTPAYGVNGNVKDIFKNSGTFACEGSGSYTPVASDGRNIVISFNDGVGTTQVFPAIATSSVPSAFQASAVEGFSASNLLRVENAGTPGTASAMNSTQFSELMQLISGTSNQYTRAGQLNGSALPSLSSGQSLGWNGSSWTAVTPVNSSSLPTCAAGNVLTYNGSSFSCVVDNAGGAVVDASTSLKGVVQIASTGGLEISSGVLGLPNTGTPGSYTKVTVDAKGRVTAGAALVESDIPTISTAGKVSGNAINSGTIGGSTAITTTGPITAASASTKNLLIYNNAYTNKVTITSPTTFTDYGLVLPTTAGTNGQVLTTNGSGTLSWTTAGGGGTVTSISVGTGLTGGPITTSGSIGLGTELSGLNSLSSTGFLVRTGSGTYTASTISNDITITNAGAATITNNAVTSAKIADGAISPVKLNYAGTMAVNTGILVRDGSQFYNKICASGETITWSINGWQCSTMVTNESDPKVGALTTNQMPRWNGTSLIDSVITSNSANVGIGTTTPQTKLDVNGTIRVSDSGEACGSSLAGGIRFSSGSLQYCNGSSWSTLGIAGGGSIGASDIDLNGFKLYGNSTASGNLTLESTSHTTKGKIYLNPSGGNVAIGHTSPSGALDVKGDFYVRNSSGNASITALGNGGGLLTLRNSTTPSMNGVTLGSLNFSSDSFAPAGITSYSTEIHNGTGRGSDLQFFTTQNAGTTPSVKMKIDHNGNVGIGTPSPGYKLDVLGYVNFSNSLYIAGGTAIDTNRRFFAASGTTTVPGYIFGNDTNSGMFSPTTSNLAFSTNSSERLRIDSDGNVGIGTSTPDQKLVVFNGSSYGRYTTSGWTHSSDKRLKHDIKPLENSLEKILQLRGVSYLFNSDTKNKEQLGFIAQEVEPIFPEVVVTDSNGFKSMVYANLVAPIIESIKVIYTRLSDIEVEQNISVQKIEQLKAENAAMKSYLCAKDPSAPFCKQ